MLYLFAIVVYLIFNSPVCGALCRNELTGYLHRVGDLVAPLKVFECHLCKCQVTDDWKCDSYVCNMMNCKFPRYGEVECCKSLKCPGNILIKIAIEYYREEELDETMVVIVSLVSLGIFIIIISLCVFCCVRACGRNNPPPIIFPNLMAYAPSKNFFI